ncbi:MAG: hypothetical protein ACI31C_05045, partial [Muribaculaceae bacterium]
KGFVETDHSIGDITLDITVDTDGTYSLSTIYANGNGPVNTENKCVIRTLSIDGNSVGKLVMPHRGVANWDDWGSSNPVVVNLSAGTHRVVISFNPEDENMNLHTSHALLDRLIVKKLR